MWHHFLTWKIKISTYLINLTAKKLKITTLKVIAHGEFNRAHEILVTSTEMRLICILWEINRKKLRKQLLNSV